MLGTVWIMIGRCYPVGSGHRRQGTQQSLLSGCSHSLPQGEIGGRGLLSAEGLPVIFFHTSNEEERQPYGEEFQVFQPHGVQHWEALGSLALSGLSSFQDCFHPLSSFLLICYSLCLKQAFWWVITVCFRNEWIVAAYLG